MRTMVDMTRYESEPTVTITGDTGRVLKMYRSLENPNTFLPVREDGTAYDLTQQLQDMRDNNEFTK